MELTIEKILDSREIKEHIEKTKSDEKEIKKQVTHYTKQIAARYNSFLHDLSTYPLKKLLNRTFNRIYVENTEYIQEAEKGTIIYASNHKSYTDPPLLGWVLHQNKKDKKRRQYSLSGINVLEGPFLNWFLRRVGAFTIDRENKDPLYLKVFGKYFNTLLEKQIDTYCFIEGGRSYDGRLKHPRLGLLKTALQTQKNNPKSELFIIPTAVVYNQVLEDKIITNIGIKTTQRNFITELKELFSLLPKYKSDAYITFSKPINLKEYSDTRKDLRNLAERVIKQIEKDHKILPTFLFAAASYPDKELTTRLLEERIYNIKMHLKEKGSNIDTLDTNLIINDAMKYFAPRNIIEKIDNTYIIKDVKLRDYYANTINISQVISQTNP